MAHSCATVSVSAACLIALWAGPAAAGGGVSSLPPESPALLGPNLALAPSAARVIPAVAAEPVDAAKARAESAETEMSGRAAPDRSAADDRMSAFLRALFLMGASGSGRPFPTIPVE